MPCRGPQKGQISLFQKRDRPLSEARNGYCNGSAAGRRRWRQHSLRLYGIRRPFGRQAVVDRGRHFHALCPPALCHRFLSASCSAGKPAESGTVCGTCALRGAQEARAFAGGLSAVLAKRTRRGVTRALLCICRKRDMEARPEEPTAFCASQGAPAAALCWSVILPGRRRGV